MSHPLLGVIVVGDGAVVSRELALLGGLGLTFAVDNFVYPGPDVQFCSGLQDQLLTPALRLREHGADVVLIACTTALMQCPAGEAAAGLSQAIGLPVISVADAMVALAETVGFCSLAIATPYGARNNGIIRTFFEQAGLRIAAFEGLDLDRSLDHWRRTAQFLTDREVTVLMQSVKEAEADAICLPSTGIASLTVAAHADQPVLTALGAGVWASMQRLGGPDGPTYDDLLASIRQVAQTDRDHASPGTTTSRNLGDQR